MSLRAVVKTEQDQWDLATGKNPSLNETLGVYPQARETQSETSSIITCLHISFQAITKVSHTIKHHLFSEYSLIPEQVANKHDIPYLLPNSL